MSKMTMSQKILAAHCGLDSVRAGQLITAKVNLALGNDVTAPVAVGEFEKSAFTKVHSPDEVTLVMDHFVPNKDIKSAEQVKQVRRFAEKHAITKFFDAGRMGVEHALLPESGYIVPGEIIIGADSHTCTYGALNAFSTGVGSTDLAYAMGTGQCWFKVPAAINFVLTGKLPENVSGKDLILTIIGNIGVDGALYQSMEFSGPGVKNLNIDDRLCIANMAIEAGGKNGIFPYDEVTEAYLKDKVTRDYTPVTPDGDAEYVRTIGIDLSTIERVASFPHLPSNTKTIASVKAGKIPMDQVVIGSCTNGRFSDFEIAAEILKGKAVAPGTRVMIIPATQKIWLQCVKAGFAEIFVNAGCVFSTPTCGPCLGGHMGILAANEKCASTTNRNFVGRMGHKDSEVYLVSPYTAAKTALAGFLTD